MAGKGDISSRITSQLPSHKAKQESLHLQGNPQSQLCVINMLKHMADRSNAWRFEILNSLCKTRGSFKFLMRGDRVGTVPRVCGAGGLVNSSLHCAGQGESPVPTQAQLEPQRARAQSSHSPRSKQSWVCDSAIQHHALERVILHRAETLFCRCRPLAAGNIPLYEMIYG